MCAYLVVFAVGCAKVSRRQFGMTGVFLSVPRYDWCVPLPRPSSCMLVNHGPSQQSSREEYKPWKWGATARFYTSHRKTMLPTRKSVPRSRGNHTTLRPPDHRKETQTGVVWSCLRSSGLAKTILQGTVKRGRRQGRQRKRWEDNIREWRGLEFAKSQTTVENREKWRKLVAKSSVVPQQPLRLRGRWEKEMSQVQLVMSATGLNRWPSQMLIHVLFIHWRA